jgi:hypothetical protein
MSSSLFGGHDIADGLSSKHIRLVMKDMKGKYKMCILLSSYVEEVAETESVLGRVLVKVSLIPTINDPTNLPN